MEMVSCESDKLTRVGPAYDVTFCVEAEELLRQINEDVRIPNRPLKLYPRQDTCEATIEGGVSAK